MGIRPRPSDQAECQILIPLPARRHTETIQIGLPVPVLGERFEPLQRRHRIEIRKAPCRYAARIAQCPQHAPNVVILFRACPGQRPRIPDDDTLLAAYAVAVDSRPLAQRLVQITMAPIFAVQNGRYVLRPPFPGTPIFLAFRVASQRKHLARRFAEQPVCSQRVRHVAQHRVIDAVSDEADCVVAEQFAHKSRRPSFRQVGKTEISAGDDQTIQISTIAFARQQTVEIDEAALSD